VAQVRGQGGRHEVAATSSGDGLLGAVAAAPEVDDRVVGYGGGAGEILQL
jgi:hypothetical protein